MANLLELLTELDGVDFLEIFAEYVFDETTLRDATLKHLEAIVPKHLFGKLCSFERRLKKWQSEQLYASGDTKTKESVLPDLKLENTNIHDVVQAVAVPVKAAPTVDVSCRLHIENAVKRNENGKKKTTTDQWVEFPSAEAGELLGLYKKLAKFRLTSLVVITAMGGYAMAPAAFDLGTFAMCSLGTGLVSAAANSINQYHEVPFDSQMSRTKNRVLVVGKLTPLHAIGFAAVSATAGLSILYFGVNGLTAALGAGNLILYTSIYTPMKRMSILNTWIGSIVGAIPPLMGWAGCAGELSVGAWILAGLLYAWQFPHFNALSWNLRPDYSRAGYRMMAVTNPDLCRRTALRYTIAISGLTLMAPYFDVTNIWFAAETLPLNLYFIYLAYKFYKKSDSGSSRKLFRFSLVHLPALMLLFIFNKKRWIFMEPTLEDLVQTEEKLSNKEALVLPTATRILPVAIAAPPSINKTEKLL